MSIEDLRELQLEWFGPHKGPTPFAVALGGAFDQIGFTDDYVEGIVSAGHHRRSRSKVVKDNVWGMIELDESAIRLLDCPVLQRLRRIRQLGLSYLTYPSAEHSRFVHSLGMFGVISRFIQTAARQRPGGRNDQVRGYVVHDVSDQDRLDLQHAALLHDSGHLPFSHVTEVALQSLPSLAKVGGSALDDFFGPAEKIGVRNPKLAELLSVAIVLSPQFGRFYSEYVRPINEDMKIRRDGALRVASLIIGRPTDDANVAYADLISGRVIDADKLDYVSRDGMACGIPTGIDVGRLFLRSAFLRFTKDELNRLRRRWGYSQVECDQVHFIVNSSGRDTIEELISARTSLYHRVYFHQTTRNAERIYEQLIERALSSAHADNDSMDALAIWARSDEQMLATLKGFKDPVVSRLAGRVSSRQLPKRAVVFGQGELAPLLHFRQAFQRGQIHFEDAPLRLHQLQRFSKRRIYGNELTALEASIRDETLKLLCLIHADLEHTGQLPKLSEEPSIAVSPPQFSPAVHDDCLVLQNHELVYAKELHNVTQTNDAEEIFQASGYVLTDEPWRELVFVAARKVFAERTQQWTRVEARVGGAATTSTASPAAGAAGLGFGKAGDAEVVIADAFTVLHLDHEKVVGRANLDAERLHMIEVRAGSKGYFDTLPFLMAKPDIRWEELRHRFDRFEGQYGWQVSKPVAETFVWQFPARFRVRAVELLHSIEVLDVSAAVALVHQALRMFQGDTRSRGKIRIAPLSPNSGHELRIGLETAFRSNEEFSKQFSIHHSLEELFASDTRSESPIALIDDNLVSASQAFAQIATWLGFPREQWPANLAHETNIDDAPLTPESRTKLLDAVSTRRLGLCVAIGSLQKSRANRGELTRLIERNSSKASEDQPALFNMSGVDLPLFCGRDVASATPNAALRDASFVAFLAHVGENVLAWARHGKALPDLNADLRKQCRRDGLGYDKTKGLMFTYRNVPVSTLTCLWAPGRFNSLPWMPLGLRRGYGKWVILT